MSQKYFYLFIAEFAISKTEFNASKVEFPVFKLNFLYPRLGNRKIIATGIIRAVSRWMEEYIEERDKNK